MSLVQDKVEQLGEEYVTLLEMAHRLHTTPNAIYLWMRKKRIRAVKVGQTIVVCPSDVAAYKPKVVGRVNKHI